MTNCRGRLYEALVLERYYSLVASNRFVETRSRWLREFSKRVLFNSMDAWLHFYSNWQSTHIQETRKLEQDIEYLSNAFSLAEWQIVCALFIKGYYPQSEFLPFFPTDLRHPRASITVGQLPDSILQRLSRALSSTNIQLILDPSLHYSRDLHSQIPVAVDLDLPIDIPIRHGIDLVRTCRSQSISILNDVWPGLVNSTDKNFRATYLICYESPGEFTGILQSISDRLGMNLVCHPSSFSNPGLIPNPFSNLKTSVRFAPSARSADVVRTTREGIYAGRTVSQLLGISMGKRLRSAPVTKGAADLKVNGDPLLPRGIGDLLLDMLGDFPGGANGEPHEITKLKSTLKSRRNQILQRFRDKGLLKC